MINDQNRHKVFLVIIAVLLLTNIGMLVFLLQGKETPKQADQPDKKAFIVNLLQEEIGFDQQQLSAYDTLSNQHRERMGKLFEQLRKKKAEKFRLLAAADFADSAISHAAAESAASQEIIDVSMYHHCKNIRQLCSSSQRPKFDSLFVKVFNWREELKKRNIK